MRDAWELQNHLDALVVELDALSKQQDHWADEGAKARDEWEPIFDAFCETLQSEYDDGDHKGAFPGQDRLESMCRRATAENREVWRRIRRAEHMLEKKNRRASNVKQEIGGLQSILKTLGTEAAAAGSVR
jgi:hypothetical protein